jgi:hypothetical protein
MRVADLTLQQVQSIKSRLNAGEYNHDIAFDYRLNQGRISEINTGKRWPEVLPLTKAQGPIEGYPWWL